MAFKFNEYHLGGGGSAVLGELTVTENGVYDNPTIEGERSITWDCVVGDRATGTAGSGTIVKVSDEVFSAEEFVGCTFSVVTDSGEKEEFSISEDGAKDYSGVVMGTFFMFWSFSEAVTDHDIDGIMQVTVPEPGTYFAYVEGLAQSISLVFPTPISTPADGWNKVTVNVAGDIVDVAELPTENIEEGKIYRVTGGDGTTYGIPNAHPVKRLVDGAWVELA